MEQGSLGLEETGIARIAREGEVVQEPIKIHIGVNLPKDDIWFWVEFNCWGQGCGTLFLTLEDALRWCVVGYSQNLFAPVKIKDKDGDTVFAPEELSRYVRNRA